MKTLDYGVQELETKELKSIDGGIPILAAVAIGGLVVAFGIGVYNGYQEQKEADNKK